jgi:glycosyltransferase involved in cell wall biosynthesis
MPGEQNFLFLITAHNVRPFLGALIASIAFQRYSRWRAIFVDDCSTDGTSDVLGQLLDAHGVADKFEVVAKTERRYKARNVLDALQGGGQPNDVVVMLDGDDHLATDGALERLDREYDAGWEVVWSNWRGTDGQGGTSHYLNPFLSPRQQAFVSGHLFSFKRSLFDAVVAADLQDDSGQWLKCACDVAIALPILDQTIKRKHIEDVLLIYNRANPLSHDAADRQGNPLTLRPTPEQAAVSRLLCSRPPKPLVVDRRFLQEHLYELMQAAAASGVIAARREIAKALRTKQARGAS